MAGGLRRELGFWDSVAINVGVMVGIGIFRVPSEVAGLLPSTPLILLAWILGGLVACLGSLCYAQLASRFPEAGGTYVYLREAYGKFPAFLFGWLEFSMIRTASIAALATLFADYGGRLVPFAAGREKAVAVLVLLVLTMVNAWGVRPSVRVQNVLSLLKIAMLVALGGMVFWLGGPQAAADGGEWKAGVARNFSGLGAAMIPILWVYGGWHESTFMAAEFRDPKRTLPLSLIAGTLLVCSLYVFVNAAYLKFSPPSVLAGQKTVAADILLHFFGSSGERIMALAVLISAAGALNSTILTGGRIPYAVARDFPRLALLGGVSGRFGTPFVSILMNSIWAVCLVLWGSFERLLFFSGYAVWFFFALTGGSLLVFRKRAGDAGSFSGWGHPWAALLFTLCSCWLFLATVLHAPREAAMGFLFMVIGAMLYPWVKRRSAARPPGP